MSATAIGVASNKREHMKMSQPQLAKHHLCDTIYAVVPPVAPQLQQKGNAPAYRCACWKQAQNMDSDLTEYPDKYPRSHHDHFPSQQLLLFHGDRGSTVRIKPAGTVHTASDHDSLQQHLPQPDWSLKVPTGPIDVRR